MILNSFKFKIQNNMIAVNNFLLIIHIELKLMI